MRNCANGAKLSLALMAAWLTGAGAWMGGQAGGPGGLDIPAAGAQCPTDFFVYFNDKPDDLAPGNGVVNGAFDITAITSFDLDGSGPQVPTFIAAIHYIGAADCAGQFSISSEWSRIDKWDIATNAWVPISPRFDGFVSCFAAFDEDEAGPNPPRLYIGGHFGGWSGISSPNIMRFDGVAFSAVRNGVNGDVNSMLVFDDDATGPTLPKLYVGGDMTAAHASDVQGQINCGRLLRLTGGRRWENPSSGFDDRVLALCAFDEDGGGAGIPKLVAAGAFSRNDTQTTHSIISVWNGSSWSTLGTGLDRSWVWPGSGRRAFTMCSFDEDGTGPKLPSLFVGGTFYQSSDGVLSPLVIRWRRNETTGIAGWLSVPSAIEMDTSNHPDSCTDYCSNLPHHSNRFRVTCLAPFDIDGTGPLEPELYIGGDLDQYNPFNYRFARGLMKWNRVTGTEWVVGDSGRTYADSPSLWSTDAWKSALAMLVVPANPSVPPRLLVAGGGIGAGLPSACQWVGGGGVLTMPSGAVSAWGLGGAGPAVSNQPDNSWINTPPATGTAFGISATGTGPFTYRWRRNGADLVNGTGQGFGNVLGATGPATIITGITQNAQGWYDCRVSNACGTGYSSQAWLVIEPDATPYFPIRFDSPVAPVVSTIGNTDLFVLLGLGLYPRFFTTVEGTPFAIAPTGLNTWRSRTVAGSATGDKSVTIPTSRFGVGEVYTLMNTEGGNTTDGVRFSFSASGGASYTTTLMGGNHFRSHRTDAGIQTLTSPNSTQVYNSGNRRLDRQRIVLPANFRTRTLSSITITDLGTDATSRVFIAGLTLKQRPPACGAADLGSVGGLVGDDGVLDNNDFIAFVDLFFAGNPAADLGRVGGLPGGDGVFDNNDFIVFIDLFFAGC